MTTEERFETIEKALTGVAQALQMQADSLIHLTRTVSQFNDAADARMRRIEDNLDGLIRAITAEHSNVKSSR